MAIQKVGGPTSVSGTGSGQLHLPLPQDVQVGDVIVVHGASQASNVYPVTGDRFRTVPWSHQGYPDFAGWFMNVQEGSDLSPLAINYSQETLFVAVSYRGLDGLDPSATSHSVPYTPDPPPGMGRAIGATLVRDGVASAPAGWVDDGGVSANIFHFHMYHINSAPVSSPFTVNGSSWRSRVFTRKGHGWTVGRIGN